MEYKLIRSQRRSLAIEVRREGVLARAPMAMPLDEIEAFLRKKEDWIRKSREKLLDRLAAQQSAPPVEKLSAEDIRALANTARQVIPQRVAYYASLIGVRYGRITIRNQRSLWGSCSSKGNLNFNCLLMLTPPEVVDSVVVHELCHRKHMDHSKAFYDEVLRVFPDYRKWDKWLKDNGKALIARMG
ncbi:MAG: M48 family metallopeptidase [Clostridia bacterium]|nr:M48 family metallopeptidase [Clostridia bacterium]